MERGKNLYDPYRRLWKVPIRDPKARLLIQILWYGLIAGVLGVVIYAIVS